MMFSKGDEVRVNMGYKNARELNENCEPTVDNSWLIEEIEAGVVDPYKSYTVLEVDETGSIIINSGCSAGDGCNDSFWFNPNQFTKVG